MKFLRVLVAVGCVLLPWAAWSATCTTATTNGNWNTAGNWSCTPGANHVPVAGDDVVVNRNFTVNVTTATLASLTITAGTLTQSNAVTVSGDLSVAGTINSTQGLSIGGDTTITSTGRLNVTGTGGNHTHSGDVTINAGGIWNVTANEPISIGGNLTNNGTFTSGSNTYTFTGANAQILGSAAVTFAGNLTATSNLAINKSAGTALVSGTTSVTGNLTVASGTFNVTGATTVSGSTSVAGTLGVVGTGGAKTFTGDISIASGGTWNVTVAETFSLAGNLTNNGTFNSNTGTYTFTAGSTWSGTSPIGFDGSVSVSANQGIVNNAAVTVGGTLTLGNGATFTNNADVDVSGSITGSNAAATWTNAANSTLEIDGALLNTGTLDASASPNTVTYTSATNGQVVKLAATTAYYNLVLSGASKTIGSANGQTLTIGGDFSINAGATYLGTTRNPTVNLSGSFTNDGTFNSGAGVFSLLGSGGQVIGGASASTFTNLKINNAAAANTVTINTSLTVSGTLTFTQGKFVTGVNAVIIATTGTIANPTSNSYVIGNFQKNYAVGAAFSYFAGAGFPVGDATNYTPVNMISGTTANACSLTASVTPSDHPNTTNGVAPIQDSKSINRYWTLTNTTCAGAFNATFSYVNGIPVDRDAAVTVAGSNLTLVVGGRGGGCLGSGASRNCPTWAPLSPTATPTTVAATIASTFASGDGDSDFVFGESRSVFAREKEFIYTRERY